MPNIGSRPEATTTELLKEAIDESRALLKAEINLAKEEVRREFATMKSAAIAFGVAALLAILALVSFQVVWLLALLPRLYPAPVAGGVLLIAAAITGLIGYRLAPKSLLGETKERIESDVRVLKERMV